MKKYTILLNADNPFWVGWEGIVCFDEFLVGCSVNIGE